MTATRHTVPDALHDVWAEWLGQRPWDLFLTLTSERRTHPEALHKRFRYCTHVIADRLWGKHWERRGHGVEYVVGMERHRSGWPHSHAVVRLPGVDLKDSAQFNLGEWQKFITGTGGFAWLEVPKHQADVLSYTAKYILKEGDLILSDNLNPYEAGSQLAMFQTSARSRQRRS